MRIRKNNGNSGIWSRYRALYEHAYEFIEDCAGDGIIIFGLKGKDDDKVRKFGVDTPTFKRGRSHELLYLLEVNQLKDELAELVRLEWQEEDQWSNLPDL